MRETAMRLIILIFSTLVFTLTAVAAPLDDAAKSGDVETVKKLISEGADVNAKGSFGTALHWAAMNGHAEVVEALISAGADTEALSEQLGMPIHVATRRDHPDVVKKLIDTGADINARTREQFTPLHFAALDGRLESAEVLIANGADVNAIADAPGNTLWGLGETIALHLAINNGHQEIAAILRSAGAKPYPVEDAPSFPDSASAEMGREIAEARCQQCHILKEGDQAPLNPNAGPSISGIAGRPVAATAGFEYSPALIEFGGEWTKDRLYAFTRRPMLTVPGTKMDWTLKLTDAEFADVVSYLFEAN